MTKELWMPRIKAKLSLISKNKQSFDEVVQLYRSSSRPTKQEERFEVFQKYEYDKTFQIDREMFFGGCGFDGTMMCLTTKGYFGYKTDKLTIRDLKYVWLKRGVGVRYADRQIKLTRVNENHKKTQTANQKRYDADPRLEQREANFLPKILIIIVAIICFLFIKSCADSMEESSKYNHPACAKLGLKSNWDNSKCY